MITRDRLLATAIVFTFAGMFIGAVMLAALQSPWVIVVTGGATAGAAWRLIQLNDAERLTNRPRGA